MWPATSWLRTSSRTLNDERVIPRLPIPRGGFQGRMMKRFACALFVVMISCPAVQAAVEQCRFTQSRPDREACYARQAKWLAAKRKPDLPVDARSKSLDDTQIENDRLG